MVSLLITGHGKFSEGLYSSLKMVVGVNDNIQYVNFIEGESSESLKEKLKKTINNLLKTSEQVICLTDVKGGTPFRLCCEISLENGNVMVMAGANIPLLFHLTEEMEDNNTFDFAKEALENSKDDICIFEFKKREEAEEENGI